MNKANYTTGSAYPLTTEGLNFIQEQIFLNANWTKIFGTNCILKQPTQSANGVIVLDGEVLPLRIGVGTSASYIKVVEEKQTVTTGGITYVDVRVVRYAIYATSGNYATSSVHVLNTDLLALNNMQQHICPKGMIVMWSGSSSNIPAGWALCNGQTVNGMQTPDMQGKFVVGLSPDTEFNNIGKTGGEKRHKLTVAEIPSHDHVHLDTMYIGDSTVINNNVTSDHRYTIESEINNGYGSSQTSPNKNTAIYQLKNDNPTGGGGEHNNLPPYYTVAYIIKTI